MPVSPSVQLNILGARGRSFADIARSSGAFGAAPSDNDVQVSFKFADYAIQANPGFKSDIPGPAGPTYLTLALFKSAPIFNEKQALKAPNIPNGDYYWEYDDYTGQADDLNIIKADSTELSVGAWVRQQAAGIAYRQSTDADTIDTARALKDLGRTPASFGMIADGVTDATAALQRMVNAGDCYVAKQDVPYRVSDTIMIPAGRTIQIEPGTRFVWTAPLPTQTGPWKSLFRPTGDGVSILSTGQGNWYLESQQGEAQFLAILSIYGPIKGTTMTGGMGANCTLLDTNTSLVGLPYSDVVTQDMAAGGDPRPANTPTHITIRGGGAVFPTHTIDSAIIERAGCLLYYAQDVLIEDATFQGVYCAMQGWGGDSGFAPGSQGIDPDAIRKSNRLTVRRCSMTIGNAGFFSSMVRDWVVEDCKSSFVRDVGFDPEGCWDVVIERCKSVDAYAGGFTTFALNRNIRFVNCEGISSNYTYPLARIYNASLDAAPNRSISFEGGSFRCTDPFTPGTFDTGFGPCRALSIEGAEFENVVVNSLGGSQPEILDNRFRFTRQMANTFTVITMAGVDGTGTLDIPLGTIARNRIYSEVAQPNGTRAIYAASGNFNTLPTTIIRDNEVNVPTVSGYAPIDCVGNDGGNGLVPNFQLLGNTTTGAIRKGPYGNYVEAGNRNFAGAAVPVTAIS
jgi:hypothetical protein